MAAFRRQLKGSAPSLTLAAHETKVAFNIAFAVYRQSVGARRHTTKSTKLQALVKQSLAVRRTIELRLRDLVFRDGREVAGKTSCD